MPKTIIQQASPITSRYTDLQNEPTTNHSPSPPPINIFDETPSISLEKAIEPVSHLFMNIDDHVKIAKENSNYPSDGLTPDESAAIKLYTMEFDIGPPLYRVVNKALRDVNRNSMKPWIPFLRLFLKAIHKLPSCAQIVWRAVHGEDLSSKYPTGSKFAWWGISSCTTAIEVLNNDIYLGKTGSTTLFCIECQNGKSIGVHSYFKDYEKEVILMPSSYFEVVGQLKLPSNSYIIHLKEIDPPVSSLTSLLSTSIKISSEEQSTEQDASNANENSQKISKENEILTTSISQEITNDETSAVPITPYSSQLLLFTSLLTETPTEVSIQNMKDEEQRMEKEIQSISDDQEQLTFETNLLRYREKRMELEMQLMNHPKTSAKDSQLLEIIVEGKDTKIVEMTDSKQQEELLRNQIEQMNCYKTRLEKEIEFLKRKTKHTEHRLMVIERAFGHTENNDPLYEIKTKLINRESEPKQILIKYQTTLNEHVTQLNQCQAQFEEYTNKRTKSQIRLESLGYQSIQENQCLRSDEQSDADKQHQYYQTEIKLIRTQRLTNEIKLLEHAVQNMRKAHQQINDDEKRQKRTAQYLKLRERLNEKYRMLRGHDHPLTSLMYPSPLEPIVRFKFSFDKLSNGVYSMETSLDIDFENSMIIDPPKYDIFISHAHYENSIIERIKNALPNWYSIHMKENYSSLKLKSYIDNTSTAIIAIINTADEYNETFETDIIYIFKRQFPLVLVAIDNDFKASTNWLNIVWRAPFVQKVLLNSPDFETNLCNAIRNARWNLSPNLSTSKIIQTNSNDRSHCFLGNHHEWNIAYNDPARVSENYRQFITDPLRIGTDTKLWNIYFNYIRLYFRDPEIMILCKKAVDENNMRKFLEAYTTSQMFSSTLNHHLAANLLFYFGNKLDDSVDYQLVKCLIDFITLCICRQELEEYVYNDSRPVYQSMAMSQEDCHKYIVGSRIMNTSFLSASKNKYAAEAFKRKHENEVTVMCTYEIHNKNKRRTALDISRISKFDEQEVIILPLSAFQVKNVTHLPDESKTIEINLVEDDIET